MVFLYFIRQKKIIGIWKIYRSVDILIKKSLLLLEGIQDGGYFLKNIILCQNKFCYFLDGLAFFEDFTFFEGFTPCPTSVLVLWAYTLLLLRINPSAQNQPRVFWLRRVDRR